MLSVMRSYMQTCHFILLNNNCLFINGTKLVKTSRLFRFTCIVCGIQCSEMNYILLGVHLRCSYFAAKRKMKVSEKDAFFFCYAARLLSIFIFKTSLVFSIISFGKVILQK